MAKKMQLAPKTFEEALTELEQIVSDIESGQVGLEESLCPLRARHVFDPALPRCAEFGRKTD